MSFFRLLPPINLFPRGETLFLFPLIIILEFNLCSEKYSKTFSKLVLAKFLHQLGGNIQRLFCLQNCLSRKSSISRKYSKTFPPASSIPAATSNHPAVSSSNLQQQPAAATSNHPAVSSSNLQQQPAAATSSSNQQQQTATISSNNQQQQSTAETSSSIQRQQSTAAISSNNQQPQLASIHQPALTQPPATVRQASARLKPASVGYHYGS